MPGDLNLKKSWNPALIKNQKKVWEREQDALKEYQVIKQRRKEIEQEREKEELIRLQYGNDPSSLPTKQKLELNKLGWMYTDVPDSKEPEVNESGFREVEEDFLLNKDDVEQLLKGGRAVKRNDGSRFDKVATVGAKKPAATLSDDPLLMIKREQLKTRTSSRDRERSPSRRPRDDSERHRHSSKHNHSSGSRSENSSQRHTSYRHNSSRHTSSKQSSSSSKHSHSSGHSRHGADLRARNERSHSERSHSERSDRRSRESPKISSET